jgi:2-polyprenyl-3-methyl-5-hydroxy-6-metoxy-1,4-benzoquinol methylase
VDEIKPEEIEDLWGYAKRLRFVRDAITSAFPERAGASLRVLDVGCGNGSQLALPLAIGTGVQLVGIDTDSRSIEHARRLVGDRANIRFCDGRVEDLIEAEPFDVVILSEVLEHLERPAEMLTAGARLMSGNGILIVTVPNGYGEFEIDSWIFRTLRLQRVVDALAQKREVPSATDNHESGHIQFFTRARLRKLFAAAGLVALGEGSGSFIAGPIAGHLVGRSPRLIDWNARITNRLPFTFASAWYFVLRHRRSETVGDSI